MERHRLGECEEMAHRCRRVTHSAADCSCHQERSTETERGFLFRKGAFDEEGEWAWARQRAREVEREAKRMGEGWAQDRKKGKLWREKEAYTMHNVDFQKETFWLTEGEEQQKSFGGKFGWSFYIIVIWDERHEHVNANHRHPSPLVFRPESSSSLGFYWRLQPIYSSLCLIFQKAQLFYFSLSHTPQGGGLTLLRFPLVASSACNSHRQCDGGGLPPD